MGTSIVRRMDLEHSVDELTDVPAASGGEVAGELAGERTLVLDEVEARVLGCLIEKQRTTPDDYPLTGNALMRAANQSTSRFPVVSYDTRIIEAACTSMKGKGLVRFVHMPSGRATTKYRQVADEALSLDAGEVAVIGLLLLRGPQTAGELKTRSDRLHEFIDLGAVVDTLGRLAARQEPLVIELGRGAGQKETRWAHLLCGEPTAFEHASSAGSGRTAGGGAGALAQATERIDRLETELGELRAWVVEIRDELGLAVTPSE